MNFETPDVMVPEFSPVFIGKTKSDLYARRAAARRQVAAMIQTWQKLMDQLTPTALRHYADVLDLANADSYPVKVGKEYRATKTKTALRNQTARLNNWAKKLQAREYQLFLHFSVDPTHMLTEQKQALLQHQIIPMMNSAADPTTTADAPPEPEFIKTPGGEVVKNPAYKPPPAQQTTGNKLVEYAPFVGLGLGVWRLFFAGK